MGQRAGLVSRLGHFFAEINTFLGHGRMLESALIFVKLQYGAMLALSPWPVFILALNDVALPRWLLGLPFLIAGGTSLIGLVLNAKGYGFSRWFRIVGAGVGMSCWAYMLTKNMLVGWIASGINPWCTMGIVGSIWIIRRGALGLPPPGVPGKI